MKKIGMLLLTCVLLLSLTACGAIKIDKGDAVVVEVGGVSVTKAEASYIYQAVLQQMVSMYQQFGIPIDTADLEFVMSTKTDALNTIGEQLALEQELTRLGIGLTDDDIKAINELAKTQYDTLITEVAAYNQITKADAEKLAIEAAYTLNMIQFALRGEEIHNRLMDHLAPGISISDDEILERYDVLLEDQKETYEADSSQYITDVFNDSIIVSRPSGFRYIKNIVIALPDDIMAQIETADAQLYDAMNNLYTIQMELSAGEMEDSEKAELEALRATYQADFDRLNQEIEDLTRAGQDQVRASAEEVLAKAKADGADFDALLAQYSADTPTGDLLAKGYPVGANVETYVPSFTEASMALENIGDISDLVESVYGFHILQYAGDVTPGVVPLAEVKASISDLLLSEKKEQALNDEIARITESTEITIYVDRL